MSLADRIIVMNQGKIEQIGTPLEVYRESATRFVASFIGTPPANFFNVAIQKTGEQYAAVNNGIQYRIPSSLTEAIAPWADKQITLGIRPEFITASADMRRTEGHLCDTEVDFVEPQGNFSILIAHAGADEVKIVSSDHLDLPEGRRVSLNVKDGLAMFFDPETGHRIR
jgi:multiple sugar transport system ATP-binding protein